MRRKLTALILGLCLLSGILTACGGNSDVVTVPQPVILEEPVAVYGVGVAFQRGNTALRDQVWAALQVLSADGTVGQIARRWFGHDPTIIPPDPHATGALEEMRERDTFIVGFDPSMAPMSFFDEDGVPIGFDLDLAQAVADYYGWVLTLHPIRWAEREKELASGNIDSLWGGVSLTDQIKTRLDHTEPYLESQKIVVTMSTAGIRNHRGLRGSTVAVMAGSAAEAALVENESFQTSLGEILLKDDLTAALDELAQGRIDGVLMDFVAAEFLLSTGDVEAFGGRGR